ncbi:ABC transporter six-transmembrane domain-containing protein [Enterobacter bugandensis]|uniref:ABC transporter six-transmembrane domain-containing protein n=1 Tax=Enterobacter bugandensis TaxID=881260 RepID=UPI0020050277|nr:ABC transporter six-transmembrane domain-containing protein [Enterobacter bugandensis]MCK6736094.1 ABC transporter six-transmembrane domain-containing protein [Enterobacter bugandensis]HCM9227688.1 hypothetical protein [Enterobacter bugandensis]
MKNSASGTLMKILKEHKKKLLYTFSLVLTENILFLLYPFFAGRSINSISNGESISALTYGVIVFFIWGVGAARRSVDTRTFSKIYANLAVSVVLAQRTEKLENSKIAARVTLSREFVDFFEHHFPVLITSTITMCGAAIMLLIIEFWTGISCIVVMGFLCILLPGYARKNEFLFNKLNDRLEKEVDFVSNASRNLLKKHYSVLATLRVLLSDREAFGYLLIGTFIAVIFSITILHMASGSSVDAGHIYAVMTYIWMFATNLDHGPQLIEKYSQLKDIGFRVNTDIT